MDEFDEPESDTVAFGSLPIGARFYQKGYVIPTGEYRGMITITHEKIADDLAVVDEPTWAPKFHGDVVYLGADVPVDTTPMVQEKMKERLRVGRQLRKQLETLGADVDKDTFMDLLECVLADDLLEVDNLLASILG